MGGGEKEDRDRDGRAVRRDLMGVGGEKWDQRRKEKKTSQVPVSLPASTWT